MARHLPQCPPCAAELEAMQNAAAQISEQRSAAESLKKSKKKLRLRIYAGAGGILLAAAALLVVLAQSFVVPYRQKYFRENNFSWHLDADGEFIMLNAGDIRRWQWSGPFVIFRDDVIEEDGKRIHAVFFQYLEQPLDAILSSVLHRKPSDVRVYQDSPETPWIIGQIANIPVRGDYVGYVSGSELPITRLYYLISRHLERGDYRPGWSRAFHSRLVWDAEEHERLDHTGGRS